MKEFSFKGLGTALVTPFYPNGQINYEAFKWLIEKQIEAGVDFITPSGTTGESPTLSHYEHKKIIRFTVLTASKRVPVLAGTGSNSTAEAVSLTQSAKDCGADGALVVSPYYNKPTQKGIKLHYRAIAEIGLPIVLYDIPGRCGGNGVSAETILELAHDGMICGLKWASGNRDQLEKVLVGRPDNFVVLSGDDNLTHYAMGKGANGVISVLSNLMPKQMVKFIAELEHDANSFESVKWETYLSPIMEAMFIETNPIPVKTAMTMIWPEIFDEAFRLPMCEMEEDNKEILRNVLRRYNLI
ncbi:MAG: 4-hydroxy-tetrahydrodipicolinate synthase [Patescibacteria group bacterium]|jgi:4-hydroxy-tetrahydrodipicolinate synthase